MVRNSRLIYSLGFYSKLNFFYNCSSIHKCCRIFNSCINCINGNIFSNKSIIFPFTNISCVARNSRFIYRLSFYSKLDFFYNCSTIHKRCRIFNSCINCINSNVFSFKYIFFPLAVISYMNRNCWLFYRLGFYSKLNFFYNRSSVHKRCRVFYNLPLCIKVNFTSSSYRYFSNFVSKILICKPTKEIVSRFF